MRRQQRIKIIIHLYQQELLVIKFTEEQLLNEFNFSGDDLKKWSFINQKYDQIKKIILSANKNSRSWERLDPLVRAILLYGTSELFFLDKSIVINEMVEISKEYIPDDKYKFINGILDKIYNIQNEIKISKKENSIIKEKV